METRLPHSWHAQSGLLALQPFGPWHPVYSDMHKKDYEELAFGREWSAVFHLEFRNPFIVDYSCRVGGLRQIGHDRDNK